MILPIPAIPATMTQRNVIATDNCPNILKDMERAIMPPPTRGGRIYGMRTIGGLAPRVEVFESGIYTVVLAENAAAITDKVLDRVPTYKRPPLNTAIFKTYAKWYPNWAMALCCFANEEARLATPMLWWYEPMHPTWLFAPALDSHTGDVPDLNAKVDVDHTLIAGSYRMQNGIPVSYSNPIPSSVRPYLTEQVLGRQLSTRMRNGDFVIPVPLLRSGTLEWERRTPYETM
jgi:hypothetical protein